MAKYLDNDGLLYFWQKIKNLFATKSDAVKNITRDGMTFTATRADNTTFTFTQQDNDTTYSDATTSTHGLMAADDKTKLDGIATGAEVNQNAFGNVAVGSTTIAADSKTDTLTLVAGSNVTITPDATNDKITIAAQGIDTNEALGQGYAKCTTGYATSAKVASLANYELVKGGIVSVWFTNSVGDNATLNVNSTGAKSILHQTSGDASSQINDGVIQGGDVATFIYNGTAYVLVSVAPRVFRGSTPTADGDQGLVPAPSAGATKVLGSGGSWLQAQLSYIQTRTTSSGTEKNKLSLNGIGGGSVTLPTASDSGDGLMTSADKAKLDGIEDTYAKKTDIAGMYRYMGSVVNESALPATGMTTGDVYNIETASSYGGTGANVAWNGTAWDSLGEIFTINTITNAEIDTIVAS